MASRRVRIKGIANIPQRKKNNAPENENKTANPPDEKITELNLTSDQGSHVEVAPTETAVQTEKPIANEKEVENNDNFNKKNGICDDKEAKCDAINNNNEKVEKVGVPARRKFIKPMVAVNSVNRKREKPENGVVEPNKENVQEVINSLNETVIAPTLSPNNHNSNNINNTSSSPISVKITPTFIAQKDISKCGSDTEYPPPPVSPSKILNRRIKAIPKLHQRRTSFSIGSASESEDDSRRSSYGRVRNDSICSVASLATEIPTLIKEATSPPRKESTITNPPRKFRRSDQGRKIAEARRNFYQKFADGKPDKQKLTMMDLIYYNPATNPMNPRKRRETTSSIISEDPPSPKSIHTITQEDEDIDDPNNAKSEDDEDGTLAPQIKVGPNGEIVIDEKSLVIENAETKKSRKALEKAEVIDGDFDTAYGVYKRAKRAKDWPNEETLRFYKALNTIGTDFTMMCELFPNRTRRELKLKFKREEKINKALIDRAVMQPVEFDMNQLRKEMEEHERFAEEKRKRAEEVKLVKEKERLRRLERKTRKRSLIGVDGLEAEEPEEPLKEQKPKRKRRKKHPYDSLKKGINSLLEDTDDSDEEYMPNSNNEKTETKRAAIPREVKKPSVNVQENENIENRSDNDKNLEPGSLMIVPSSQSGKTLYKVFMITDDRGKQEVDMDGKTIEQLTQENNEKSVNIQNIITISENVIVDEQTPISTNENNIEITKDSIIFDFDECPINSSNNSNITISHDDNKMTIVTES
ncbi:transcription factor TFIIIB component B'' homolog isoform X1 [Onthophagus taurus]|uniref:transcription factor TFIIIB component B'' homolog isoform X1 n=1 Tax=Onthophagus taurus TaxID=166361 RepID=UPI0039BE40A5